MSDEKRSKSSSKSKKRDPKNEPKESSEDDFSSEESMISQSDSDGSLTDESEEIFGQAIIPSLEETKIDDPLLVQIEKLSSSSSSQDADSSDDEALVPTTSDGPSSTDEFLQNLLQQSHADGETIPNSMRLEPAKSFNDSATFIRPKDGLKAMKTTPIIIQGKQRDLIRVNLNLLQGERSFTSLQLYQQQQQQGSYRKGRRVKDGKVKLSSEEAKFFIHRAEWKKLLRKINQREREMKKLPVSKKGRVKKPLTHTSTKNSNSNKRKEEKIRVFIVSKAMITDQNQMRLSNVVLFHTRVHYSKVLLFVKGAKVELNGFRFAVGTDPRTLEKITSAPSGKYNEFVKQPAILTDYMHKNAAEIYEKGSLEFHVNHDISIGVRPQDRITLQVVIKGIEDVEGIKKKTHICKVIVSASTIRDIHGTTIWNASKAKVSSSSSSSSEVEPTKQTVVDFGKFSSQNRPADVIYATDFADPDPKFIGGWFSPHGRVNTTLRNIKSLPSESVRYGKDLLEGGVLHANQNRTDLLNEKSRKRKLLRSLKSEGLEPSNSDLNALYETWEKRGLSSSIEGKIHKGIMTRLQNTRDVKRYIAKNNLRPSPEQFKGLVEIWHVGRDVEGSQWRILQKLLEGMGHNVKIGTVIA